MDAFPRLALNPLPSAHFDYIAVGHVTRDLIEDRFEGEVSRPGGSAFYSALQAARLGLRALIVTKGIPDEIESLLGPYLDELDLSVIPSEHTTTLRTHGSGASRRQRVLAWAGAISEELELHTSILHFAPVAREGRTNWGGSATFVGITPQGHLRRWGEHGEITLAPLKPQQLPARYDAAVISEDERSFCEPLLAASANPDGPVLAVTAGSEPARIHLPGGSVTHTAAPAVERVVDDLGAGDVFAAAFFIELAGGAPAPDAASFASAAAAVRIEGAGPGAIGTREDVDARRDCG